MASTINVVLAISWLIVGVVLLVVPQLLEGQPWAGRLLDNRQLLGGIALVLAVYNLVRLQSIRAFYRDREAIDEAITDRYRMQEEHKKEPHEPPNPEFNFDDPNKPRPPLNRPPSNN